MHLPTTNSFIRIVALLVHALLNFIVVSAILNYDISARWVSFFLFILLCFTLFALFVFHLFTFIRFIKSTST